MTWMPSFRAIRKSPSTMALLASSGASRLTNDLSISTPVRFQIRLHFGSLDQRTELPQVESHKPTLVAPRVRAAPTFVRLAASETRNGSGLSGLQRWMAISSHCRFRSHGRCRPNPVVPRLQSECPLSTEPAVCRLKSRRTTVRAKCEIGCLKLRSRSCCLLILTSGACSEPNHSRPLVYRLRILRSASALPRSAPIRPGANARAASNAFCASFGLPKTR
jgi:hypothetical protein